MLDSLVIANLVSAVFVDAASAPSCFGSGSICSVPV
jgi:hypothetical protein